VRHPTSLLALGLLAPLTMTPAATTGAAWEAKDIRVVETVPGQKGSADTRLEMASNGDARVTVALSDDASQTKGTILLIAGRWMLIQGFTPKPGEEIDALDAAALSSQLVVALLNAAAPKGPPSPGPSQHVVFSEKSKPIRVSTQSASGEYNPPWKVEGSVAVAGTAAPATYHLSFTFSAEGQPVTLDLAGSIGTPTPPISFPDSMTLAGWAIHKIGPYQEQLPDGTKFDYGARPQRPEATTIGELRKLQ